MTRTPRGARASASQAATARAYTSPTLVLLAMDWPAGKHLVHKTGVGMLDACLGIEAAQESSAGQQRQQW